MKKPVAVLLCPGRGSYGRTELGSLSGVPAGGELERALETADSARKIEGLPGLRALDAESRFRPSLHLQGIHAAELIYFSTLAHVARLSERYEILAVGGNSLGWYTALAAAGALDPIAGWRLVHTMAIAQAEVAGGQVLTTLVKDDWQIDPSAQHRLEAVMREVRSRGEDCFVAHSIRLGGHAVLAGTEEGVAGLLAGLPAQKIGEREFPFRLAGHGPFHTRLCEPVAARAGEELRDLRLEMPRCHLIDGRGALHSPWSTDTDELLHYTLGAQVVSTFDFTAVVRTALRELAPEFLLCTGPGTSLRAPVGHVVLMEGYRGIRDKAALFAADLVRTD